MAVTSVLLDVTSIQRFVFASNKLKEMICRVENLKDSRRMEKYNRYRQKLRNDQKFSNDEINQGDNLSLRSTQAEAGFQKDADTEAILNFL